MNLLFIIVMPYCFTGTWKIIFLSKEEGSIWSFVLNTRGATSSVDTDVRKSGASFLSFFRLFRELFQVVQVE